MLGLLTLSSLAAPIWLGPADQTPPDTFVAFRGHFSTTSAQPQLNIFGSADYLVYLDGKLIHDGTSRYAQGFPEYSVVPLSTKPGRHILAVQARHNGVTTRIMSRQSPFIWAEVKEGGQAAAIDWRCAKMPGYRSTAIRVSDILGWSDWLDTRSALVNWQALGFDDSKWSPPTPTKDDPAKFTPVKTANVRLIELPVKPFAQGKWSNTYGYESDDPAVRFFLDDLNPKDYPPQGIWMRYDLGRVRLGRPKLTIDAPAGTVVEMAVCEQLQHGRVHPWLNLSGSRSNTMDHFVLRGGQQEIMPFTPKGGRYLEVHIASTEAKMVDAKFLERTYFGDQIGSFECSDPLLNRIWKTGVETVRACSEDALVDCPTRERGQWTGDVASVATEIVAAAFGDLRLSRRALVQAAQAARSDGLVAGVGPGDPGYLSTYAAQWVTACVRYWEMTGDKSLLEELAPAARKNIAAFEAKRDANGVSGALGWGFVDWGYVQNSGPTDMALNTHYLIALRSMARWEKAVGGDEKPIQRAIAEVEKLLRSYAVNESAKPGGWRNIGYHRASLLLLADLVPQDQKKDCIAEIKRHLLSCFPNNPDGPRLSDPGFSSTQLMTPYFCHFSFAALLKNGEADFVLGQYKKCWGWALGGDRTTWLEVFDTRWSHCHEWSGCPTWQLTKFVLGLNPRFDLGPNVFELDPALNGPKQASGDYPLPEGGKVHITVANSNGKQAITIDSPHRMTILRKGEKFDVIGRKTIQ